MEWTFRRVSDTSIGKGHVSKLATIAKGQGWLRTENGEYVLVTPRKPVFSAEEAREAEFGSNSNNN